MPINLFCNLFIFKEKQRQIQIHKHDVHIQFYRKTYLNVSCKQTFCSTAPKQNLQHRGQLQMATTLYIYIYSFCVEDKIFMVVFSVLK
jgi:hypothetical protein